MRKAKIEKISLKDQRVREKERMIAKIMPRRIKAMKTRVQPQTVVVGNKDTGCPFTGKDRFSSQRAKFDDRIIRDFTMEDSEGKEYKGNRLVVLDTNKY